MTLLPVLLQLPCMQPHLGGLCGLRWVSCDVTMLGFQLPNNQR